MLSPQQNMEIHLKIKRSKKELEALENQEKEVKTNDFSPFGCCKFMTDTGSSFTADGQRTCQVTRAETEKTPPPTVTT